MKISDKCTLIFTDAGSINAAFEFGGDHRELTLAVSDVERRVFQREETMVELEQERRDEGILLHAGVCLRVPFNRVVVNRARRDTSGHVDIAGVSSGAG